MYVFQTLDLQKMLCIVHSLRLFPTKKKNKITELGRQTEEKPLSFASLQQRRNAVKET